MLLTVGCPNSHVAVPPGPGRWVSRQRTSNPRRVRVASVPRAPSRNWLLKFVVNIWSWGVKMKWNKKKSKSQRKDGKKGRKNADVPCLDICRLQRVKNAGKGAHQKSMETPARIALPRPLSDWGRGYRRNQEVCHRVAVTLERESVKKNEWFLLCPPHLFPSYRRDSLGNRRYRFGQSRYTGDRLYMGRKTGKDTHCISKWIAYNERLGYVIPSVGCHFRQNS